MANMAQVGEAFVAVRARLDLLEQDLSKVKPLVDRKVREIERTTGTVDLGGGGGGRGPGGAGGSLPVLDALKARVQALTGPVNALRAGLAGLFGAAVIVGAKRFVDSVAQAGTQLELTRSRVATLSGEADAFDRLSASATRLGISVEDAADSAQRFLIARKELGLTTDQVIKLNENVVNLGRLGGSSTGEVAAGARQLAQALARGQLSGDELTSVLENLPLVAKTIAEGLGVSVGQLKTLGSQGKLTGRDVANALLGATGKINEAMGGLPETLEQSGTRFETAWTNILARLDQIFQVSPLKRAFNETITELLEAFNVKVLGTQDVSTQLRVAARDAADLRKQLEDVNTEIRELLAEANGQPFLAGVNVDEAVGNLRVAAGEIETKLRSVTAEMKTAREEAQGQALARQQEVDAAAPAAAPPSAEDERNAKRAAKEADARAAAIADAGIAVDAQRRLLAAYDEGAAAVDRMRVVLEAEAAARSAGIEIGSRQYQQLFAEIEARSRLDEAVGKAEDRAAEQKRLTEDLASAERELSLARFEASVAGLDNARQLIAERKAEVDLAQRGIELNSAAAQQYRALQGQIAGVADAQDRAEKASAELADSSAVGLERAGRISDVLVNSAEDLAFSFDLSAESVDDLFESLGRVLLRMLVLEPLARSLANAIAGAFTPGGTTVAGGTGQGSFGGSPGPGVGGDILANADGNAFAWGQRLERFARGSVFGRDGGGVVTRPTVFAMARGAGLMGEAGPEAVVPLTRTSQGELGINAEGLGAGGGGTSVEVNVHVEQPAGAGQPPAVRQTQRTGQDGRTIVDVFIGEWQQRAERGDFASTFAKMGARPAPANL